MHRSGVSQGHGQINECRQSTSLTGTNSWPNGLKQAQVCRERSVNRSWELLRRSMEEE